MDTHTPELARYRFAHRRDAQGFQSRPDASGRLDNVASGNHLNRTLRCPDELALDVRRGEVARGHQRTLDVRGHPEEVPLRASRRYRSSGWPNHTADPATTLDIRPALRRSAGMPVSR